ncbi:MAG: alpha/beta hydrolase-fold protein [Chitinophagaceae bacterium]
MILLIASLFLTLISVSQTIERVKYTSLNTGDDYEIIIKKPKAFDSSRYHTIVYFTDASLNSGKYILGLNDSIVNNCILIGIGHIGSHVMRRQRDFIPSDAGGYNNNEFGQASKFYLFVKNELMPYINRKIPKQKMKIFIGHSFGGLLALYFSLKENKLFDHYYAISPSVWANYDELLKIEEKYKEKNTSYSATVYLYAGALEIFNKVLSSTTSFYNTVKKRKYNSLSIYYKEIEWANHYGTVAKVVPGIFQRLK